MRRAEPGRGWPDTLAASFFYACSGIFFTLVHERNFRIHCAAAAYVLYFSRYYPFGRGEFAVIFLLLGLVLVCELLNTSIEKAVDMTTPAYNPLAKVAKDVAAGAVLVSALVAVAVGAVLFWDPGILALILADLGGAPLLWLFLLALTWAWIFLPSMLRRTSGPPRRFYSGGKN